MGILNAFLIYTTRQLFQLMRMYAPRCAKANLLIWCWPNLETPYNLESSFLQEPHFGNYLASLSLSPTSFSILLAIKEIPILFHLWPQSGTDKDHFRCCRSKRLRHAFLSVSWTIMYPDQWPQLSHPYWKAFSTQFPFNFKTFINCIRLSGGWIVLSQNSCPKLI